MKNFRNVLYAVDILAGVILDRVNSSLRGWSSISREIP